MVKCLSILGSTGSIGCQSLDVAEKLNIKILALSAKNNINLLEKQIRKFNPEFAVVYSSILAEKLRNNVKDLQITILEGIEGLCEIASLEECDIVLNALSGMIGLRPTLAAIKSRKNVALANKETLVVGGEFVMSEAKKYNVQVIPVDSEHSAIFQCLQGNTNKWINNLILTASGGPFWGKSKEELKKVTVDQALNHPNWKMGKKITIDSATMMNKGLEIIEAAHLFGVSEDKIKVLIHRESIVHSMVEYNDNAMIAQLGVPDMRIPIQYALTYPDRLESCSNSLDLTQMPLTFHKPNKNQSKCMDLCRKAIRRGGAMPTILNAANEEAVEMFLNEKIQFLDIEQIVEHAMNNFSMLKAENIDNIIDIDLKIRDYVRNYII